jgi:hypothetical protein
VYIHKHVRISIPESFNEWFPNLFVDFFLMILPIGGQAGEAQESSEQ